jgi:signal transduction histidine kinase
MSPAVADLYSVRCMGGAGNPLIDVGGTSEGTLPLLYDLMAQLPVSVAVYGAGEGFPLLYRNPRMVRRQEAAPAGLDLMRIQHPGLRRLAERLLDSRRPERLQLNLAGPDGERLLWDWTLSPLLDSEGRVVAVMAVVEDLSQPLLARRRMESAIDQGLHLLLEVARLIEEHPRMDDFLGAVSERVALLVQADGVAFNTYDPARRALVASPGSGGLGHGFESLPCDPAASDLLSQVVFAGRVYTGTLDFSSLEFRPYAHLAQLWLDTGTRVMIVPWRAGNERLGAVVASGTTRPEGFTEENAIVLIAAGHAAGLVWQRKRAEQRLAERAEELESLERAKSRFLMLASHELRTPLTLLNGHVSMLADGSHSPEHVGEVVAILQQALERMNGLVDQLMDATRLADPMVRLQRREVDLGSTVEGVVNRVVARWERTEDLELRLPDTPARALVDVVRVETAVENLVDNACKYSRRGTRVRCDLRLEPGLARLVVRDHGTGMTEEQLAGLFTRFGRMVDADNSHIGGTGLGLFLSREIARLHGGDVVAASALGGGSSFELRLPLGDVPGEAGAERRAR